jgi:hypothetical protein
MLLDQGEHLPTGQLGHRRAERGARRSDPPAGWAAVPTAAGSLARLILCGAG